MTEQEPQFRAVAGLRIAVPKDRPDLMLLEIKTLQGPVGLSMTKGMPLKFAKSIEEEAQKLAPDRSAN